MALKQIGKILIVVILISFPITWDASCKTVPSDTMHKTTLITDPIEGKALMTFIFVKTGYYFELWEGTNLEGIFLGNSIIQLQLEPGKHVFIVKGIIEEDIIDRALSSQEGAPFDVLETDVKAGGTYYIKLETKKGWGTIKPVFVPLVPKGDVPFNTIEKWTSKIKCLIADPLEIEEYSKTKRFGEPSRKFVPLIIKAYNEGRLEGVNVLAPESSWK